ncbi:MAG: pilus assembly protein PilM [bacterium]
MNFLNKRISVAIDLGPSEVRIAGLSRHKNAVHLLFFEIVDLPQTVSLSSLSQVDEEMYVSILRGLSVKYRLHRANISATLPAKSAVLRNLKLDLPIDETRIHEELEEDILNTHLDSAESLQLAYHRVDACASEQATQVLVCGTARSTIASSLNLFKKCGLRVSALELDATSGYNAFYILLGRTLKQPVAFVMFGFEYSICAVLNPGALPYFYLIELGEQALVDRLARRLDLTYSKGEALKNQLCRTDAGHARPEQRSRLEALVHEFSTTVAEKIKRGLRYCQSRENIVFEKIFLTGRMPNQSLMEKVINEKLQLEAECFNPLSFFRKSVSENSTPNNGRKSCGYLLSPVIGSLLSSQ